MSVWTSLFSLASTLIKRPAVWLGGILVAAVGTYATDAFKPIETFLSGKVAEKSCEYRQKPIADESQFTILVSPLANDPDRSHTERVMRAFLGEKGFLVVPICESLNFDFSMDLQTATYEAMQRARELIKAKRADLLLFGDVRERDKAAVIYAMNEHGGCNLRPKPTIIEQGDLPEDFNAMEKENLIAVSLKEIQSACLNQSSIDWALFAKRMNKMEMFLKYFDFSKPKSLYFGGSYIEAMRLLYGNDQGDVWFSKGNEFAQHEVVQKHVKDKETNKALSYLYTEYAILLGVRFTKIKDTIDHDAEVDAFDKAISLDPENAFAYQNRGATYGDRRDSDRAIEDYTSSFSGQVWLYPA